MEPYLLVALTAFGSVIASSGFWAFLQRKDNSKKAMYRLLQSLAYAELMRQGLSYIDRGWISRDELEEYEEGLYGPYKAFGGNGVAERVRGDVVKLPIKSYHRYSEVHSK